MVEKGLKAGAGDAGAEGPGEAGVEPNVNEGALLASPFCCDGLAGEAPKLKDVPEGVDAPKLKPEAWGGAKAEALEGCDWPKEKVLLFAGAFGGKLCEVDMFPKGLLCGWAVVWPKLKLAAAGGAGALCAKGLLSAPPKGLGKPGEGVALEGEADLDAPGRPLRGLMLDKQRVSHWLVTVSVVAASLTCALPTEQLWPCAVGPLLYRGDPPYRRIFLIHLVRLLRVLTWLCSACDGDVSCPCPNQLSESLPVRVAVACRRSRLVVLDGHVPSYVSVYCDIEMHVVKVLR